jgi:DNA-3-methyladenine glycosylase
MGFGHSQSEILTQYNLLPADFFEADVLEVAPKLLGKLLIRVWPDGTFLASEITEVEAYRGEDDLACHASKGRTQRTEIMYQLGGHLYVYLIYGMYQMLNIVTGPIGHPQAILIRGVRLVNGPGRLTKKYGIAREHNGLYLPNQTVITIGNSQSKPHIITTPRIGIDYAGPEWKNKPWRFVIND